MEGANVSWICFQYLSLQQYFVLLSNWRRGVITVPSLFIAEEDEDRLPLLSGI